jgi:hypothetical protein
VLVGRWTGRGMEVTAGSLVGSVIRRAGEWRSRTVPIYPVFFTLFLVLNLAAENGGELIPLPDLLGPIGVSLLACLVGWFLSTILSGSIQAGALVASVASIGFMNFAWLSAALPAPLGGPQGTIGVILYSLCASIVAVRCWRGSLQGITRYLNLLAILLATYSSARVIRDASLSDGGEAALPPISAGDAPTRAHMPDIYLLVLDKYTSSQLLASHYGFDNSPFESALRRRGFIVPSMARANYIHTSLALASMLNLQYLDDLPARFGEDNDRWPLVYPLVENNRLAAFLQSLGYEYVFFPSAFPPTRQSKVADAQLPSPSQIRPEFEAVWLATTPLPYLYESSCRLLGCAVNKFPYIPESAELLDWKFNRLASLAGTSRPIFVFAHLTLPHEPFIYHSNCDHRVPYWPVDDTREKLAIKRAYIEQIECLNAKVLTLVDSLRRRSRTPPVILLQSDHGHGRLGRLAPDLEHAAGWQVAERVAIFAAYFLPEVPSDSVSDSISPISAARLVLRHYFSADLPALVDATYWSGWERPYRFTQIR